MLSPVGSTSAAIVSWREGTAEYQRTYSALHHRPSTKKQVAQILGRFGAFLSERLGPEAPVNVIGIQDLEHYQAHGIERGLTPATVNKHLRLIRGFLRWCSFRGWVKENPTRGMRFIREKADEPRTLSKQEVETLRIFLGGESELLYDLFRIGLNTGGRLGEILWLEKRDVDFPTHSLHFRNRAEHQTKGGYSRILPVNESARAALERRMRISVRWLFESRRGKPYDITTVSARFSAACEAAGLEGATFHALRRTFGTEMAQRVTPAVLMKLMGHRHISVTMRYYVNLERFDHPPVPVLV